MNRQTMEKLKASAEARIDAISDKENATDYDQDMESALEGLIEALDEVLSVMDQHLQRMRQASTEAAAAYIHTLDSHDCVGPFANDQVARAWATAHTKMSYEIVRRPPYLSTVVHKPW